MYGAPQAAADLRDAVANVMTREQIADYCAATV